MMKSTLATIIFFLSMPLQSSLALSNTEALNLLEKAEHNALTYQRKKRDYNWSKAQLAIAEAYIKLGNNPAAYDILSREISRLRRLGKTEKERTFAANTLLHISSTLPVSKEIALEAAISVVRHSPSKINDNREFISYYGKFYKQARKIAKAHGQIKEIEDNLKYRLSKSRLLSDKYDRSRAKLRIAREYIGLLGDCQKAFDIAEQLRNNSYSSSYYLAEFAYLCHLEGKTNIEMKFVESITSSLANENNSYNTRGSAYSFVYYFFAISETSNGVNWYRKVTGNYPDGNLYLDAVKSFIKDGQIDEAKKVIDQSYPGSVYGYKSQGYTLILQGYSDQGKFDQAINLLNNYPRFAEDSQYEVADLARHLFEKGEIRKGMELSKKFPSKRVFLEVERYYALNGELDKALDYAAEKNIEMLPAAEGYAKIGDLDSAAMIVNNMKSLLNRPKRKLHDIILGVLSEYNHLNQAVHYIKYLDAKHKSVSSSVVYDLIKRLADKGKVSDAKTVLATLSPSDYYEAMGTAYIATHL